MSLDSNQNAASAADSNEKSAVCRVCLSSGDGAELHSLFDGDSCVKDMFDVISGYCVGKFKIIEKVYINTLNFSD
jgi:hypothetical protein